MLKSLMILSYKSFELFVRVNDRLVPANHSQKIIC